MKKEDILVIDVNANDCKEVIRLSGEYLFNKGYVKETFADECIKRESVYPTGLPTLTPIAIPHCSSKFVNKESLCVTRLKNKVDFHRMDDLSRTISTSIVFNLALKKDEEHVVFLQKFINALSSEEGDFVKECMNASLEDVPELFVKYNIL